jgi:single-stranded DNA-binding protein
VAGEVVRVAGDTLTVRTDGNGQTDVTEQTVRLTECTIWQGAARAATNLRPGDRILLSGHVEPDGSLSAEIVVVLPP